MTPHTAALLSQIAGSLALAVNLVAFTRKSRRAILLWSRPGSAVSLVSQACAHEWQGMSMNAVGFISGLVQAALNHQHQAAARWAIALTAMSIGVACAPPLWGDPVTWLPLLGFSLTRLGEAQPTELRLRTIWLGGSVCWTSYFVFSHNPAMAANGGVILSISLWRFWHLWKAASGNIAGAHS